MVPARIADTAVIVVLYSQLGRRRGDGPGTTGTTVPWWYNPPIGSRPANRRHDQYGGHNVPYAMSGRRRGKRRQRVQELRNVRHHTSGYR